jgi:hypothetical protein
MESNPWWAIISAEKELGMEHQPLTTVPPPAHISLSVFFLTNAASVYKYKLLSVLLYLTTDQKI